MRRLATRCLPLALILTATLLGGCPEEDLGGVGPLPSRTPTPTPRASGDVQGGIETGSGGPLAVRAVILSPSAFRLNAPAVDGLEHAGLASSQSVGVQVLLGDGSVDSRGVTWGVSDPTWLSVQGGWIRLKPGTPAGSYAVTATSVGEPAMPQTALVQVTADGLLRLRIEPSPAPDAHLSVNVVRNGAFVLNQELGPSAELRLPAGAGYVAQVQRTGGTGDRLGVVEDVAIAPNEVTVVTVSLQ